MPLPSQRNYNELRERLLHWLIGKLPEGSNPEVSEVSIPEGTGMSSETLLFDMDWKREGEPTRTSFVVRMSPDMSDYPVFPTYDLELQYRVLNLVRAHTNVPVPETPWLELDPAHLGSAFLVMQRIEGIVPPDNPPYVMGSWLTDATPEQRVRLQRSSVEVLARLHALDLKSVDASFLERPQHGGTPLDQHLNYQRSYYDWAREGASYRILEAAFEWLEARRPDDPREPVLNWGDSRIGNILYRDFEPVAVLDWEMAAIGAPEADLGWMLFMHRFFENLFKDLDLPRMPDFMRRDDVVGAYERSSGKKVRDLEFWEVFAALRYAIISLRTTARGIAYEQMEPPENPEDRVMIRELLEQLLDGSYWTDAPS